MDITSLILKLSLPFLDVKKMLELWETDMINATDVSHYICERFPSLADGVDFKVVEWPRKLVKTIDKSTWDMIFNGGELMERVLRNRFMSPRLRTRVYLGLKNSDPRLLNYYKEYYEVVKKNSVHKFTLDTNATSALFGNAPLQIDDRLMAYDDSMGTLTIVHAVSGLLIAIIYHDGVVELVDVKKNRDLTFLLPNTEYLLTLYNQPTKSSSPKRKACDNEHRRPKIRRRCTAS